MVMLPDGNPLAGVSVNVYGSELSSITDASGAYEISGVPDAAPRYIVVAEKEGCLVGQQGFVDVVDGQVTEVDFTLLPQKTVGLDLQGETLMIGLASLLEVSYTPDLLEPSDNALLDLDLYPDEVMPYLGSGNYITPDDPAVRQLAEEILATVPEAQRQKMTVVAKAIYNWVVMNIDYDLMKNFPGDVSSGNWQTTYGGWGRNFSNWCYTPAELIEEKRGICIEYERLTTSLLRALDIPARPAPLVAHPVSQWWNQNPNGSGYWVNMETSRGHVSWEEWGDMWAGFPSVKEHLIGFVSVDAEAPIHIDWNCMDNCIWYEFGGQSTFEYSSGGLKEAHKGMNRFFKEGSFPRGSEIATIPVTMGKIEESYYFMTSRGVALDLNGLHGQSGIRVRFPLLANNAYKSELLSLHWTNHPEWLSDWSIQREYNEQSLETLDYLVFDFDFTGTTAL